MSDLHKDILNKGTLIGIFLLLMFLLAHLVFDFSPFGNFKWLSILLQYVFLFLFGKKIIDIHLKAERTFRKLFRVFMLMVFVYASLYCASTYIYGVLVEDSFTAIYKKEVMDSVDQMSELFPSQKDRLSFMEEEVKLITTGSLIWGEFLNKLLGGIVVSLILSLILKKSNGATVSSGTNN